MKAQTRRTSSENFKKGVLEETIIVFELHYASLYKVTIFSFELLVAPTCAITARESTSQPLIDDTALKAASMRASRLVANCPAHAFRADTALFSCTVHALLTCYTWIDTNRAIEPAGPSEFTLSKCDPLHLLKLQGLPVD